MLSYPEMVITDGALPTHFINKSGHKLDNTETIIIRRVGVIKARLRIKTVCVSNTVGDTIGDEITPMISQTLATPVMFVIQRYEHRHHSSGVVDCLSVDCLFLINRLLLDSVFI